MPEHDDHVLQTQVTRRQRGATMTEVIIAVAIAVGLGAAAFTYLTNVEDYRLMMTRTSTRDAVAKRIETQLRSYRNVEYSARVMAATSSGNAQMRDCLDAGGGNCIVKAAKDQVPFMFYVDQGAAGPALLAGTEDKPVLYNYSGQPNCVPDDEAGCPAYKAVAYFWAACAQNPCPQATSVSVRFQVTPLKAMRNGKVLPASPQAAAFKANKSRFAITHLVRSKTLNNNECPVGSWQKGYDTAGKPICECSYAHTQTGVVPGTQMPICTPTATCAPGQVVSGVDKRGKPRCGCITVTRPCPMVKFDIKSAQCPNGGWLESLDMGYCAEKLGEEGGKSNKKAIGCDHNRGRCCSYRITKVPASGVCPKT